MSGTFDVKPAPKGDPEFFAREFCNRIRAEVNDYRRRMDRPTLQPEQFSQKEFENWNPAPYRA